MAAAAARSIGAGWVMSNGSRTTPARPASSFSLSGFRMVAKTFHARAENSLAAARPRPDELPVMKTALGVIDRSFSLPGRRQRDHWRGLAAPGVKSGLAPWLRLSLPAPPALALQATNMARRVQCVQDIVAIESMLV